MREMNKYGVRVGDTKLRESSEKREREGIMKNYEETIEQTMTTLQH